MAKPWNPQKSGFRADTNYAEGEKYVNQLLEAIERPKTEQRHDASLWASETILRVARITGQAKWYDISSSIDQTALKKRLVRAESCALRTRIGMWAVLHGDRAITKKQLAERILLIRKHLISKEDNKILNKILSS